MDTSPASMADTEPLSSFPLLPTELSQSPIPSLTGELSGKQLPTAVDINLENNSESENTWLETSTPQSFGVGRGGAEHGTQRSINGPAVGKGQMSPAEVEFKCGKHEAMSLPRFTPRLR